MTATITHTLGRFVWRELLTPDVAATKRFYGSLFGWTFDDRPMGPDWSYTLVNVGDKQIAGVMDLANMPEGSPEIPPHWAVYVSVADVDAAAKKAVELGGKVLGDCHDIPGVGRFAVLQDPQGGHFNLFRASAGDPEDVMPGVHEFVWESLSTSDPKKAVDFYQQVVGWGTTQMEGSDTTLFTRISNGQPISLASIGEAPAGTPVHWGTFVGVKAINETLAKAKELGGQVLVERTEIPNVGAFAVIQDTTEAVLFLFEDTRG